MKQLCWIIIALFMGKLTNVQMFLTEQSLLSPDQDQRWGMEGLCSGIRWRLLRSFVWPLTLQNVQTWMRYRIKFNALQAITLKITHLHLPLKKCCSWEFWSWNGFVCYNSFLISDSRESLDQACLAEENIVSKYFSMKICHKFPKCVFNVKQSF